MVAALEAGLGQRDPRLRWGATGQWHVTTAFYGEVPEDKASQLADRLADIAARTPQHRVTLGGLGGFPRPAAASVVFARLDGDLGELRRLADRCAGAGRRTRIAMEKRAFRPHLTVARVRDGRLDVASLDVTVPAVAWRIDALQLVRSTIGATVTHEVIAQWPLTLSRPAHGDDGGVSSRPRS